MQSLNTGWSKKNPAKFSDSYSVRADGLCIGCRGQWGERGRDNSNMQEFFRTTLYIKIFMMPRTNHIECRCRKTTEYFTKNEGHKQRYCLRKKKARRGFQVLACTKTGCNMPYAALSAKCILYSERSFALLQVSYSPIDVPCLQQFC